MAGSSTTRRTFGGTRTLPSGRVQAYYTAPDGVRRTLGTYDTTKAARDALAVTRADLVRGRWHDPRLGAQRLDAYAVGLLASRDDLAPTTRALYARLLDLHVLPTLGRVPLDRITPAVVRDWYTALATTTGPTARAQAYRHLRAVMGQAVRDQVLPANPCTLPGGGGVQHTERVPATLAQVRAIAAAVPARYRLLVLCAAFTGLRYGELTALRRRDIVDGDALAVTRAVSRVGGQWLAGPPKTAAGRRTVHLPPHLVPELADHLARFVPDDPDALLFASASGSYLARSSWGAQFRKAADGIGRPDLRFHDLRHTGATLAAQAGATTAELQARLGHASSHAAMIYQHAAAERDRSLALALSDADAADLAAARDAKRAKAKRGTGKRGKAKRPDAKHGTATRTATVTPLRPRTATA